MPTKVGAHRPFTAPQVEGTTAAVTLTKAEKQQKPESELGTAPKTLPQETPTTVTPTRVKAEGRLEQTVFNGWLKVHRVAVDIQRGGLGGTETVHLHLLQRPGHDSTHVETMQLNGRGPPSIIYKDGDTRPTAALRGTPYVATGIVAGSLDHDGVDAEATALMEIGEELGGNPIGKLVKLGDPMPTMPVTDGENDVASSESDNYYLGVLSKQKGEVRGDGGGLEVIGLMKPLELSVADALKKIDSGGIRENARARVALSRGLDKAGFVPQLNAWVHDLPPALREKFDTLGLGATYDPRELPEQQLPEAPAQHGAHATPAAAPDPLASKVNAVDLGAPKSLGITQGAQLLDGPVHHVATNAAGQAVHVGKAVPVQTLHVDHDRLKLAQFFIDPKLGPMVKLDTVERPLLVAKGALTGKPEALQRQDVTDLRVPLPSVRIEDGKVIGAEGLAAAGKQSALEIAQAAVPGAKVKALSAPSFASPGQSDLQYHFLSAEVPAQQTGFVPLGEALLRCRSQGAGDANTEALLVRLADSLQWVPQLGMSVSQAKALAGL